MKLNKAQTEALAELGLRTLLKDLTEKTLNGKVSVKTAKTRRGGQKGRRWTKAQHTKFARSMRKVWEAKKQAKK